jgi:hypothetical protein
MGGTVSESGFDSGQGQRFSLFCSVQTSSGSHSAFFCPVDTRVFDLWIKQLWHGTDNSPPSSAGVRSVLSIRAICFHGGVFN